ncbi:hypothetical protein CLV62_12228 [Dysgonomonas alginatilytica]|uniref:Uncharacterized protein n=1 Tax=Dysgonomonas alginatilytica TaxID=1605892 RepID=A0A2V3PLG6_9BACT|nr:hypothetical protein [Dysgonomonas alginatilytica]PXV62075.1 hypothetical protein CLV62_12228 [Dysgonomonas alginatilytica]
MTKGYYYKRINGLTYRYSWGGKVLNIDLKLNDAFAISNGYKCVPDMLASENCLPFDNLIKRFGEVPKYLPLRVNGKLSDIAEIGKAIQEYHERIKNL